MKETPKEAIKAFLTIVILLLGAYFVYDGAISSYSNHDSAEAVPGLLLIAAGLTAIWIRYKDKILN